jgi:hypothetical protein
VNHARFLVESAVAEAMGGEAAGQGNAGSPDSDGASPYLSRLREGRAD